MAVVVVVAVAAVAAVVAAVAVVDAYVVVASMGHNGQMVRPTRDVCPIADELGSKKA